METKDLIANLREWHENLISELCADDVLTCDDLCGYPGPCIVIQAANLLDAQQKRIEELEAALREQEERRWISADERLPEKSGYYLVASKTGIKVLPYSAKYNRFNCCDCWGDDAVEYAIKIDSWMPLPEPPKEDC